MDAINPPVSLRLTPPLRRGAREGIFYDWLHPYQGEQRESILRQLPPYQGGEKREYSITNFPLTKVAREEIFCD